MVCVCVAIKTYFKPTISLTFNFWKASQLTLWNSCAYVGTRTNKFKRRYYHADVTFMFVQESFPPYLKIFSVIYYWFPGWCNIEARRMFRISRCAKWERGLPLIYLISGLGQRFHTVAGRGVRLGATRILGSCERDVCSGRNESMIGRRRVSTVDCRHHRNGGLKQQVVPLT